jgi:hypothetical protein
VTYTLDAPYFDLLSMSQASDSVVRVLFSAGDATEDSVRLTVKRVQYITAGGIVIDTRVTPFPVQALDTGFANLYEDVFVRNAQGGWDTSLAVIYLNSPAWDADSQFRGTDTSVLRLRFELSDFVPPTQGVDYSVLDSVVIDRKGPSVGIDFTRSTVTMICSVSSGVWGDLSRIYYGPDSLNLTDTVVYPDAGQTVSCTLRGYYSICVRLVDALGNYRDTCWKDFDQERLKLSRYTGGSAFVDNGIVVVDVALSSVQQDFRDDAYLWVGRLTLTEADTAFLNSGGFGFYLPLEYWFMTELSGGISQTTPDIYESGLTLRYYFDPSVEGYDSLLTFYRLYHDSLGDPYLEHLGGFCGIDSSGRGFVRLDNFRVSPLLDTFILVAGVDVQRPVFNHALSGVDLLDSSVLFSYHVDDNTVNLDARIRLFTFDTLGQAVVLYDTTTGALGFDTTTGALGFRRSVGDTLRVLLGANDVLASSFGVFAAMWVSDGGRVYYYSGDTLFQDTVFGAFQLVYDTWHVVSVPWGVTGQGSRNFLACLENFQGKYDGDRFRLYGEPGEEADFQEFSEALLASGAFDVSALRSFLLRVRYQDDDSIPYRVAHAVLYPPLEGVPGYRLTGAGWRLSAVPFNGRVPVRSLARVSRSQRTGFVSGDPSGWSRRIWRLPQEGVFDTVGLNGWLPPRGEGFLVHLEAGDTLVLPVCGDTGLLPLPPGGLGKAMAVSGPVWTLGTRLLRGGEVMDGFGRIGVSSSPMVLPDLVFPGSEVVFGVSQGGRLQSVVERPARGPGHVFELVVSGPAGAGLSDYTLCLTGLSGLPEGILVYLEDRAGDYWTDLRESGGQYGFAYSGGRARFRVVAGDSNFVRSHAGRLAPQAFALSQNYPNPFNPATVIAYQVPDFTKGVSVSQTRLTLDIYAVNGRRVARLLDGPARPGYYRAVWHGTDARGRALGSGLYFYRFTVSDQNGKVKYRLTKKMIMVK